MRLGLGLDIWNIKIGEPGIRWIPDTGFSLSIAGEGIEEYSLAVACLFCVYVSICPPIVLICPWLAMCISTCSEIVGSLATDRTREQGYGAVTHCHQQRNLLGSSRTLHLAAQKHYQEEGKEYRKLTSLFGNTAMKMPLFWQKGPQYMNI